MKQASYMKRTVPGTVFDVINVVLLLVLSFIMIYPFWNQLVISLNDGIDAQRGGLYFWPRIFTLGNYSYILKTSGMLSALGWSVARVVVGTLTKLVATGFLAYVTTVKFFSFHKPLRRLFLITMYVSGGMIPIYLWYMKIGLTESFTVYWLPTLLSAYEMMIIASYIEGLPEAMSESARIDGANEITIFVKIIMPLCIPVFAALGVMVAVGHWNSWFDVLIYNPSGEYDTLQISLRNILIESDKIKKLMQDATAGSAAAKNAASRISTTSMRAATTMIVTIPIVCVYPFFQKYFVKGISIGAVKG
jgi:putative aldouronate transport system permease protein